MSRIPFLVLVLLLTTLVIPVQAAVEVTATVDRTTVMPGDSVQLQIAIEGGKGEVDTAAITDFQVVSRGSSSSYQFINGRTSRQVIYTYLLIPMDPNQKRLTVPALTVTVDGDRYTTQAITIQVAAPADSGTGQPTQDVWVTAEVSNKTPFVGQQFIYTFSLFNAVQVTDARFQPPAFDGFSARVVEKRRSETQIINGREVARAQIDYVLIPLAAGKQTIEPSVAQVGVVQANRQRRQSSFDDFFDSPFLNRQSVTPKIIRTQPLSVEVKPLPPYQGQLPFSGVVGRFTLSANLENSQLKVGDSTTLAVTLQGEGNIMDAAIADIPVPEGLKTYADAPQDQVALDANGYHGRKVFRIAIVPTKPGHYALPKLEWVYFDTVQNTYRTLSVNLPSLEVQPGEPDPSKQILVQTQPATSQKETVEFTGRDILPLKEGMEALIPYRPLSGAVFAAWMIVPVALFAGLVGVRHMRRPDLSPAAVMKSKARRSLAAAKAAQNDPDNALTHLYQALTAAIFAAAGRSGETLTWKEAESLLAQCGLDPQLAREAADTLSMIESAKFSGTCMESQQCRDLLTKTEALIRRLAS